MEMKLEQFNGTQDDSHYTSIQHGHQENENTYESTSVYDRVDRRHQPPPPVVVMKEKKKETSWSRPLLFITVLLCLILILLIIILGIVTVVYATGNINIVNTLSNLQDTSTSTAGVVDDILLIAQELLVLHNDSTPLPTSCKEIKERQPLSPSGVYLLATATIGGATYTAYCNMDELCGSGGGWTRLAYLDMTDTTQNCPSGFGLYQSGGVRACGRQNRQEDRCVSVQFPSNGISYSQICGRVTGYQYGKPDALLNSNNDINSDYAEGVSITRGSPRQHVWTLMAGYTESDATSQSCPCNTGSSVSVQSFIGNNYFCESGSTFIAIPNTFYTSDPLWDGQGCGSLESPCCNVPGIPWFHRDYGSNTTTDYIELRVCGNQGGEDSPVTKVDIYVK